MAGVGREAVVVQALDSARAGAPSALITAHWPAVTTSA